MPSTAAAPPSTPVWQRPVTSVIFSFLLVFLCGTAVGALTMIVGLHHRIHQTASWTVDGKPITLDHWKKELELTPAQTQQLEMTLDDFSKLYDNVLADGNSRILQILDARQQAKFQKMLQEHRYRP